MRNEGFRVSSNLVFWSKTSRDPPDWSLVAVLSVVQMFILLAARILVSLKLGFPACTGAWIINMVAQFDCLPVLFTLLVLIFVVAFRNLSCGVRMFVSLVTLGRYPCHGSWTKSWGLCVTRNSISSAYLYCECDLRQQALFFFVENMKWSMKYWTV